MKKADRTVPNKDEVAAAEQPNHTERIKSQVLAKIGKPPRLDRVEVSRHHNGNYRVNIWQQPVPNKDFAVTFAPRVTGRFKTSHREALQNQPIVFMPL